MRVLLYDELPSDYFELQAELKARRYCKDCRRRTFFRNDMDGIPLCLECAEHSDEATEALEI